MVVVLREGQGKKLQQGGAGAKREALTVREHGVRLAQVAVDHGAQSNLRNRITLHACIQQQVCGGLEDEEAEGGCVVEIEGQCACKADLEPTMSLSSR